MNEVARSRPYIAVHRDPAIIREFLAALADRQTYDLRTNVYMVFGILWGLPIPMVTIGVDLYVQHLPLSFGNLISVLTGHPFQVIFLLHPLLFGILFGAMGTVRDRKQQRILGLLDDVHVKLEEMEALNEQLRETDRLKDEFLSTISHELKTPLVTVRGYGEMLQKGRGGPLDAKQTRYVELMLKNVDRQIHLIDDLLNYVRIGARPEERERQELDLHDLILKAGETFRPSIEEKGLTLQLDLPDEPLTVHADRSNVEIILSNLLSNAIKFTEPGGRIRLESHKGPNGRIVTTCSDTGCGITEESLPYIFERFRQGDGSTRRKHPGTGLGLAIIKKVLDNYQCPIEVQSRLGEGTTFRFELPGVTAKIVSAKEAASD